MDVSCYERIDPLQAMYNSNMNELYKAVHRQTQQTVIIKARSKKASDNPQRWPLFEDEIRMALGLEHEHILRPLGRGEGFFPHYPQSVPFIVYPYMPDGSLEDALRWPRPPVHSWPLDLVARVLLQAASALMHIHTRTPPIVHCDVKPDNFLVQYKPGSSVIAHLYLIDFGIAYVLLPEQKKGTPRGTPFFMAPEQFMGEPVCQTDQYALALIACYLLSGKYPFQPDRAILNWETWEQVHRDRTPYAPGKLNPQRICSQEIDSIILKALDKKPERRFPTIWDFAIALAHAIQDVTHTDLSTSFIEKLAPFTSVASNHRPIPLQQIFQTEEQPDANLHLFKTGKC